MGAMAPPPHWTPKDDVLLKSAVEAGASLESLAKGAVQFSQRYTVQELQDRWSCLLYDPSISEEASAHMIEIERSTLTNQSRNNKLETMRELIGCPVKRKGESIRKCYYARRKRICNEPFEMMGVNLFSQPGHSILGDGNEIPSADCGIGNPISSDLGIQGPDFDLGHHSFSEFGPHPAPPIPPFATAQNHVQELQFGGNNVSHNLSYPFEENLSPVGDHGGVHGFDQSNVFESEGIESKENPCLEFGGPSFRSFGSSSPLPQMPVWSTSRDIPVTNLPIQRGESVQPTEDTFLMPPIGGMNANEAEPFRCDVPGPSSNISTEDYFAELSNTLFDFSNDDELLFMDNGKESLDKSYLDGLSSLLLDSPNPGELADANSDQVIGAVENGHFFETSTLHLGELENQELHLGYEQKIPDVLVASSASALKNLGPEYRNGIICCMLNTEDPEIPSNDDVFLPFRCPSPLTPSRMPWRLHDANYFRSSPPLGFSSSRKANMGPPMVQNNQDVLGRSSHVLETSQPLEMGLKDPAGCQGIKFELPKSSIHHAAVRNPRNREFPNHISSANVAANNAIGGGIREMGHGKGPNYKSGLGAYLDKFNPGRPDMLQTLQSEASSSRNEMNAKPEIPKDGLPNVELTCQNAAIQNSIDKSLMSDRDGDWSENDFDVPNFSDVEAMVLDMDLSPDEFDIHNNPEVQRFQQEETKRTIIKLEQSAKACAQRAITSQGAFAVLYSRYLKYFIKKPEVLLGRATEDIVVDIDLGREKNGGKISRRQATLKMDAQGMFQLKNLGKCSVYVNGNEVASGQSASLTSGCLVQIRGLVYVFETNRALVEQYKNNSIINTSISLDQKPPVQKN